MFCLKHYLRVNCFAKRKFPIYNFIQTEKDGAKIQEKQTEEMKWSSEEERKFHCNKWFCEEKKMRKPFK